MHISIILIAISLCVSPTWSSTINPAQNSGKYCNYYQHCGSYLLTCYHNQCLCSLGYTWNAYQGVCEQKYCTSDSDCLDLFNNTECIAHTCQCNFPTSSLESATQTCLYDPILNLVACGISIGFFVFLVLAAICCCRAVRRRRYRIQHSLLVAPPSSTYPQQAPQVIVNVNARGSYGAIGENQEQGFGPKSGSTHYAAPPPYKA